MIFTESELDNLSRLSRIDIAPNEKEKMLHDMQAIIGYISEINDVAGTVTRAGDVIFNVVREDVVTSETGSNTKAILHEAPLVNNGYVEVTQVIK